MNPIRCWCPDCGEWLWSLYDLKYVDVCPACERHITIDDVKVEYDRYAARVDELIDN